MGRSEIMAEIYPLGFWYFLTRNAAGAASEIRCQTHEVHRRRRFRVEGLRRKRLVSHDLPRPEERRYIRARLL